jgi:hypothetical protein
MSDNFKSDIEFELTKFKTKSAVQGLTLVTLCYMVLGEDALDQSDDKLVRGVRELLCERDVLRAELAKANSDGENLHAMVRELQAVSSDSPVRSSELVRDSEPRYSKMELIRAVNACCTCGGGGPGQKDTCPACEVYHALATVPNEKLTNRTVENLKP